MLPRLLFTCLVSLALVSVADGGRPSGAAPAAVGDERNASARLTLAAGQSLGPGQSLQSPDGHYRLTVRRRGDVRLTVAGGRVLWRTETSGHRRARLVLRRTGALQVRSRSGNVVWSSGTRGHRGARLTLGGNANLSLADGDGGYWRTDTVNSVLRPGESLRPGWFLQDETRTYTWVQQRTDGNLVLYGPGGALWSANTAGHPAASTFMQSDGNLVTYDGPPLWASGTDGHPGAWAVVQGDGNLVVYDAANQPLWDRHPDNPPPPQVEQVDIMAPVDGVITSHPSNHHIVFGGDWSEDIGTYGRAGSPVFVRFANPTGNLSLAVEGVRQACSSGQGGLAVDVGVSIDGVRVGRVTYAHLANLQVTSGGIANGGHLGDAATGLPVNDRCWTGPHVHFEPYNQSKYSCYDNHASGAGVGAGTRIGILGGNVASGVRQPCG